MLTQTGLTQIHLKPFRRCAAKYPCLKCACTFLSQPMWSQHGKFSLQTISLSPLSGCLAANARRMRVQRSGLSTNGQSLNYDSGFQRV